MSRALHKIPDRQMIPVAAIKVQGLLRRPRRARVETIARSMAEAGQRAPIEVCPISPADEWLDPSVPFRLTSGWVRLEAAELLGWGSIQAEVKRATATERRKREIEDNLLQDGATVLDRARYLAAGKLIYEAEHPETRHGGVRRGDQVANVGHLKPYHAWSADRYGLAERSVRRACMIGEGLDASAGDTLADTAWADHQQGLESLVRLNPGHQQAVAQLLTREPDPLLSITDAIEQVVGVAPATPEKRRWSAALSNYASMGARERKSWLRQVVDDGLVPAGVSVTFDGDA